MLTESVSCFSKRWDGTLSHFASSEEVSGVQRQKPGAFVPGTVLYDDVGLSCGFVELAPRV